MRNSPPILAATVFYLSLILLAGCTTIENRRDLYFPQKVEGPYTRMLQHGLSSPSPTPVVFPKGTGSSDNGKNVIKPQG